MSISVQDKEILRTLAKQYAENTPSLPVRKREKRAVGSASTG